MVANSGLVLVLALLPTVLLVIVLIVLLTRSRTRETSPQALALLQQQLDALRQQTAESLSAHSAALNQQLAGLTTQVSQQLGSTHQVVERVSTSLGELSQASQRILAVGQDISSLQDILRAPKLRGIVGELFLGDLLKQVVPANHELQHRFQSGETVDAVVRLGPRLVPIDAKFPLESFQQMLAEPDPGKRKSLRRRFLADVRKHVDAVAKKYILPDEGTFDFALMYIPAENVYYETIIKEDPADETITGHALARRVIPVSPNSLYAYLQAIVLGLRGLQIEKRAEEILKHLGRLQQEFDRFSGEFETLGNHLKNAQNKYDDAAKRLTRFEEKLAVGSALQGPDQEALPRREE